MKLQALIAQSSYLDSRGDLNAQITDVVIDSRKVKPGDLYICIPGTKVDGHAFARAAMQQGAAALAVEHYLEDVDLPQVRYADCRKAFSALAATWYGNPAKELSIIGITGTNGKTTTSYLLKSIFEKAGEKVGLMGTIATIIGDEVVTQNLTTPDPMDLHRILRQMKDAGCTRVVMEVSAHALALHKLDGILFDVGVFTNLTQDHLDDFKTMERYRDAKRMFFRNDVVRAAVGNADDANSAYILGDFTGPVLHYGIDNEADVRAYEPFVTPDGIEFDLRVGILNMNLQLQLTGHFNIYNALAAAAAARLCKVPLDYVVRGLEAVQRMNGRMERVDVPLPFTVLVDYAHTPDGLENVIRAARALTQGKVITVFGCGGDRDKTKRPLMGGIAARGSDIAVVTSDNPRTEDPLEIMNMIEAGMQGGCQHVMIADREEAIRYALHLAQMDDVVLIAGKGHETYQDVMGVKRDFDDKEVVRRCAAEMQ